nr:unnamed protein product [Callosobruchus chinensis]
MYMRIKNFVFWPSREQIKKTMPQCFKEVFHEKTTVIIDCFEIRIQKPSLVLAAAQSYSNYKHGQTIKYLIGITPQGSVCFISEGWGGRVSDKCVTENSEFLKNLIPGDVVMADRGFLMKELVELFRATVEIPGFTRGHKQLHPVELEKTRAMAQCRIHVGRVIGLLRQKFNILNDVLSIVLLSTGGEDAIFDKIVHVCCALINLCPPIVTLNAARKNSFFREKFLHAEEFEIDRHRTGERRLEGRDLIDYRGKHVNRPNKMTEIDIEKICQHIRSFPLQENHYSRNESSRQCLSPDLNLKKMHRLFVEKYPDSNISERTYTDIFKSKFNLRFGIPRSDTCGYCDKLYIKLCATDDEGETQAIMRESKLHHMRADAGYKTLKADTEVAKHNTNTTVLFTDLQQVLSCPTLTHSSVFYQRQLATHNYAIHDAAEGNATMMLWHEAVVHRGSTEIASTLLFYIWQIFDPLQHGQKEN